MNTCIQNFSLVQIIILHTMNVLFFLLFPLCRGEAGLLVTAKYGYFRDLLPSMLLAFSLHFSSSSAFLRSHFKQSSHLSCGLPRFLEPSCFFVSVLFGSLTSFIRTMCPAHFIRLLTILPTIQALVPTSSRTSFILRLSTLLTHCLVNLFYYVLLHQL